MRPTACSLPTPLELVLFGELKPVDGKMVRDLVVKDDVQVRAAAVLPGRAPDPGRAMTKALRRFLFSSQSA